MCGGSGTRLWPKSREILPKQFLKLTDEQYTMYQLNCKIALSLNPSKFIIICNKIHKKMIDTQMDELNITNYCTVCEPFGKNTAAAISCASILCDIDDTLLVLTSDHVWDEEKFKKSVEEARYKIDDKSILFWGIKPTYPETGYGYIQYDQSNNVSKFVEKPSLQIAEQYVTQGNYLWNSGIFMFLNKTIIEEFKQYAPDIYDDVSNTLFNSVNNKKHILLNSDYFEKVRDQSIDYAIMEHHKFGKIIEYDGYWSDIGSFEALYNHLSKYTTKNNNVDNNILNGDIIAFDSKNSYIESKNKLIAVIGVEDLIVIDTDDALLITTKAKTQMVKNVVNKLKTDLRKEL
jgi:mannose-1-phosphate guanylyltransferase/mannose-6-phosphate isomerase